VLTRPNQAETAVYGCNSWLSVWLYHVACSCRFKLSTFNQRCFIVMFLFLADQIYYFISRYLVIHKLITIKLAIRRSNVSMTSWHHLLLYSVHLFIVFFFFPLILSPYCPPPSFKSLILPTNFFNNLISLSSISSVLSYSGRICLISCFNHLFCN